MVNSLRATMRAIWHNQSFERVAQASWKWAPRHNERNPTHTKWREGCASKYYIYRCSQIKHCAHQNYEQLTLKKSKNIKKLRFTQVSATFWPRSTKCCTCHEKWARGTSEVLRVPHGIIIMLQIKFDKTRSSTLSTRRPSEPNTAPATKNRLRSTSHFDPCLPTF